MREAGQQDDLPRGLLARAAFYRSQDELTLASADLGEVHEIAERGGMKWFLAKHYLEASRLPMASAREHLAIAARMIEEAGHGRRKPEGEELGRQLEE